MRFVDTFSRNVKLLLLKYHVQLYHWVFDLYWTALQRVFFLFGLESYNFEFETKTAFNAFFSSYFFGFNNFLQLYETLVWTVWTNVFFLQKYARFTGKLSTWLTLASLNRCSYPTFCPINPLGFATNILKLNLGDLDFLYKDPG